MKNLPSSQHAEPWQAESSLSWSSWLFCHTRSHFLLGVYVEDPDMDPDMDPEGRASLCIHCIHQLYFFWTFVWLYFQSLPYLEMRTDQVNNTPTLLTIVNTMSILFFWSYGYICAIYHIWKCTQTMLTLLQHCQQQSTSCLFFFCFFFSHFLAMFALIAVLGNAHRPHEQCTNIVINSV